MPFDPKEYLKNSDSGGARFDPKAYLAQDNGMDVIDAKKPAQAFVEHLGNAATLGYLPHLQAAAFKLLPDPQAGIDAKLKAQGTKIVENKPSYVDLRDENIKRLKTQDQENPVASGLGTGTGILSGSALMSNLLPMAPAATFGAKVLKGGTAGAIMGGLQNPGDKEGEIQPVQPDERLFGAGLGFATGAGSQALFSGLGKLFSKRAQEKAAKAAGFGLSEFRKANQQGTLAQHGQTLLDEGIVTPGAGPKTIAERLGAKISEKEAQLAGIIDDVENKLSDKKFWNGLKPEDKQAIIQASFKPQQEAKALKQALREKYSQIPESKLKAAFDEIDSWLSEKGKALGIRSLQEMKVQMNRFLKESDFYKQPASFSKEGTLSVRRAIKEGVEKKADALARVMEEKGGQIKETNQKLGSLYEADKATQDKLSRIAANRILSPSDYGMGALGSAIGAMSGNSPEEKAKNALLGFSLAGANKLGRTYGPSMQASIYNAIAKKLGSMANSPVAVQNFLQSLIGKGTGAGGFEPMPAPNPEIIDFFRKNPQLLENIQDNKMKAEIKKSLERSPAENSANVVERRMKKR